MVNLQTVSLQPCRKNELYYIFFCLHLRSPDSRKTSKKKGTILKINAYFVTQGIYAFHFLLSSAIDKEQKRYMASTEWKCKLESAVHCTWKWHEHYSISLLMSKQTDLQDSTIRLHLYITALLTLYIVKKK